MALAVTLRVDFQDQKGKKSFTNIRIPNGFTIAQYTEFAQAATQLLSNISVATITGASISVGLDLSGSTIKAVAAAVADVAHKGFFQFGSVAAGFFSRLRLPAFDETLIPVGTDAIDQADPDVAAFIASMTNGIAITSGTLQPTTDREDDLNSVQFARELFRKT